MLADVNACRQIVGGVMSEDPIAELYADAQVSRVYGGRVKS